MAHELPEEIEALRKIPFFEGLTPEDLERIATIGEHRTFAAGEPIVGKAGVGGGLFIILSGTATVDAGGKTHALGPGQFFGEMALLSGTPRSATVMAAASTPYSSSPICLSCDLMCSQALLTALPMKTVERLADV